MPDRASLPDCQARVESVLCTRLRKRAGKSAINGMRLAPILRNEPTGSWRICEKSDALFLVSRHPGNRRGIDLLGRHAQRADHALDTRSAGAYFNAAAYSGHAAVAAALGAAVDAVDPGSGRAAAAGSAGPVAEFAVYQFAELALNQHAFAEFAHVGRHARNRQPSLLRHS